MALDKDKIVMFAGKKFTLGEFLVHYGLDQDTEASVKIILEHLEKKGKLHYIEQKDKDAALFESVAKELELEAKIAEMEAEAERVEVYDSAKKKEGKLVYEEVEIDFPNKTIAIDFYKFAQEDLKVEAALYEEGDKYVLTMKNVSESDLAAIKRKKTIADAGKMIFNTTDKVANVAVGTAAFATERVLVPTTKATVKTALGLSKSLVKTGTVVGSNLVTSTTNTTRQMVTELANDEDVLKAKKELIDAKDAIVRMFRRKPKVSADFRIK